MEPHESPDMLIAHAVRHYGGVTEPFIEQRVAAAGPDGVLWFEELAHPPVGRARRISAPLIAPGSVGDRAFHRIPALARLAGPGYKKAEALDRPSLIHAHYLTTGFLVGSQTRAPLVVSAYGFDVSAIPRRRLWRRAFRRLALRADHVLVEGPYMRKVVRTLGFPSERVAVVPISIDVEAIEYRGPVYQSGAIRCLSAGRFVEKKGHDSAIMAFARLLPRLPSGSTLQLVGDGAMRSHLETLVESLGLSSSVTFRGTMQRIDYFRLLQETDVLIAASRTARNGDSEGGAPTTILDAQATGVLVIGSDHADIPFLIHDEMTGFIAQGGSMAAIEHSVSRALHAVRRWPEIAAAAREQVQARHSPHALRQRLAEIYEQIIR